MTTRNRELASIIDDSGNITTGGNLSVTGNLTQSSSTTTTYSDGLLELNNGAGSNSNDLGLVMERGSTGDNAIFLWDESNDGFAVGTTTATGSATGNISFSAAPFTASTITGTILNGSTSVRTPLIEYTDGDDALTIADGGAVTTSQNFSIGGSNNELRFYEGSNYVGFEAPALSADKIWVLPAADGSSGQLLKTDGSGNLSFTDDLTLANASVNNYSGDGSTTGFTLSTTPVSENATQVYINGVYQFKNTYAVSGTTLTFDTAPANGSSIEALVWSTVAINVPADASVTNAKLNASIITGQSEVTAADADHVLIYDASSSALKKTLVSDLLQTSEEIQDIVGAMFSSNTETGIAATYQDGDGTIDLVIGDDTIVSSMLDTNIAIAGTLGVTGNITGTLATAAQTNITSLGTLTALTGGTGDLIWDTNTLFVDSSANKIYIGDTASHTDDFLQIESPASGGGHGIQIRRNDSNGDQGIGRIMFGNNNDTDLATIQATTDGQADSARLAFFTQPTSGNSTERMRIDASGNVGIGVTPSTWPSNGDFVGLQVGSGLSLYGRGSGDQDRAGMTANAYVDTNNDRFEYIASGHATHFSHTDGNFRLYTAPSGSANGAITFTERLTVLNGGNVGIGPGSPSSLLHVDKSHSGTLVTFHQTAGSSGDDRGLDVETSSTGTTIQRWINSGTEKARITGSGYLMVGTTSSSIKDSSGSGNEGVVLGGSLGNTMAVSNADVLYLNRKTSHGNILEFRYNGTGVGGISTNTNSLPSDRNFKKDIEDLNIGLDLVTKLKPKQYRYKHDENDMPVMYGVVAQDLETSLTEVGVTKNSSWLLQHVPKEEKESDYSLDYTKLTPILIKAIQEQQTIIEDLKTRIETLEG